MTRTLPASAAPTRPAAPARRRWSRERAETLVFGVLRWVVVAVLLVATLFPMYYMVVLSLRSLDEVVLRPALLWPAEFDWSTYVQVLVSEEEGGQGFLVFLRNSAILAVLTVVFTLLAAVPGAYAISRLEFFGRRQVSALFLAVYLFPAILLAVPLFVSSPRSGCGVLVGLVVVYVAQTVPLSIYMLRNYFETVPAALEEAAAMDGARAGRSSLERVARDARGRRGNSVVRVHDRLERVPVRAVVPGRATIPLGPCRSAWPVVRRHRDSDNGAHGRVGAV